MDNAFFDSFNAANEAAARVFGEPWSLLASATDPHGTEYGSVAIEKLTATARASLGGRFQDVTTTIEVLGSVARASGVRKDSFVRARGEVFRVKEVSNDGDDSSSLLCGPAGNAIARS